MGVLFSCCNKGAVSSRKVIEKYGEWEKPSEEVAAASTLYFRSHHESFPVMKTTVGDLHEFGEGHTLYFFFLQSISRLFFLLFLISGIPTIFVSVLGDFYKDDGLDAATIGNIGHFHNVSEDLAEFVADTTSVENEKEFSEQFRFPCNQEKLPLLDSSDFSKEDAVIIISLLDGFRYPLLLLTMPTPGDELSALVFFFAVLWISRIQDRISVQVEARTITVADYSLRVDNLPEDTSSAELLEFFSKRGDVLSTELVKTDCELIERARIDRKLTDDMKLAIACATKPATQRPNGKMSPVPLARIKLLELRKEKADKYTHRVYSERRLAKTVCAFVTMETVEQRLALLNTYPRSFGRRLFMRRDNRFRGKYRIKTQPAPQPADIIVENLQFRYFSAFLRKFSSTIIKYFALSIGFVFINIATSLRHNNPASMSQEQCDADCGYFDDAAIVLSLSDGVKETYRNCYKTSECTELQSSCYQCYCEKAVIEGLSRDESSYCQAYLADFATSTASAVFSVVGVVFINLSLTALATKLAGLERHHTRIGQETSLAHTLFVFQFMNTAISYLVATTHIPRLKNLVKDSTLEGRLFVGVFVDTTPNWYREVGRSLTITMVVQSATRIVRVIVRWLLYKWKHCWRRSAVTQNQMNEAYMGPEFTLAIRYGELLNLIFVTMFFGGGIPVLYLVTAVSFSMQFLVEKAELLRLSRRPTSFGSDLAKMVGRLLPYAALWHFVFSAWSFSFQHTVRSPAVARSSERGLEWIEHVFSYILDTDDASDQAAHFGDRLMQVTAAHHVVLFIVIALLLLIKVTMQAWTNFIKKALSATGCINDVGHINNDTSSFTDIKTAIRSGTLVGPTSYALKSNPVYLQSLPTVRWASQDLETTTDLENERKPLMSQLSMS